MARGTQSASGPEPRIQVLGLCRFSLLSEGAFQVEHDSLAARRAFLYDPARLEQRFLWFEHVTLPSLRAQTDGDFTLVVLTGEDLPQPFLDRLGALVSECPGLALELSAPGPHRDLCRAAMTGRIDPAAGVVAQFRLDDDDAVAVDFVERLRSDFRHMLDPLYRAQNRLSVDHARGLVLDAEGPAALPVFTHNWTPGLALFLPPDSERAILDFPHHNLSSQMPGVTFQDTFMYVRGKHPTNDSQGWARRMHGPLPPDRARSLLRRRFAIDLDAFAAALRQTEA